MTIARLNEMLKNGMITQEAYDELAKTLEVQPKTIQKVYTEVVRDYVTSQRRFAGHCDNGSSSYGYTGHCY